MTVFKNVPPENKEKNEKNEKKRRQAEEENFRLKFVGKRKHLTTVEREKIEKKLVEFALIIGLTFANSMTKLLLDGYPKKTIHLNDDGISIDDIRATNDEVLKYKNISIERVCAVKAIAQELYVEGHFECSDSVKNVLNHGEEVLRNAVDAEQLKSALNASQGDAVVMVKKYLRDKEERENKGRSGLSHKKMEF